MDQTDNVECCTNDNETESEDPMSDEYSSYASFTNLPRICFDTPFLIGEPFGTPVAAASGVSLPDLMRVTDQLEMRLKAHGTESMAEALKAEGFDKLADRTNEVSNDFVSLPLQQQLLLLRLFASYMLGVKAALSSTAIWPAHAAAAGGGREAVQDYRKVYWRVYSLNPDQCMLPHQSVSQYPPLWIDDIGFGIRITCIHFHTPRPIIQYR
jgi:hypothetical protein